MFSLLLFRESSEVESLSQVTLGRSQLAWSIPEAARGVRLCRCEFVWRPQGQCVFRGLRYWRPFAHLHISKEALWNSCKDTRLVASLWRSSSSASSAVRHRPKPEAGRASLTPLMDDKMTCNSFHYTSNLSHRWFRAPLHRSWRSPNSHPLLQNRRFAEF